MVYNGGGQAPWSAAGKGQKNGQRPISLSRLRALDADVAASERLRQRNELDLRE